MKNLIIIGAGDFAREAVWVAERMNQQSLQWNICGFVDDEKTEKIVDGYPVLGPIKWLKTIQEKCYVVCAIATGRTREKICAELSTYEKVEFATLIDPAAIVGKNSEIGVGTILCAGTVLAVSSKIGRNTIVNLNCTIGHDAIIEEYCTIQPGTNLSGRVHLGKCSDIGTGSKVIQGISVAPYTVLGAGTVVTCDLTKAGTYVGIPARKIK